MFYESNSLQSFIFEKASIRGEIAHLNSSFETIINQRAYPPFIKQLLGEALLSCLLLSGTIKFEGELSLQFQSDEQFPLLIVQCNHKLELRAFAHFKENLEAKDYAEAFLRGKLVLTMNQYQQTQNYQSVVPILSTSMAENLMHYFAQSEQIPTRVWLACDEKTVAGMILQLMPGQGTEQREEFWQYATQLGQTITEHELLHLENAELLHRLYHETEIRLFDAKSVRFQCRCSKEKMQQVLTVLGEQDLRQLIAEQGSIAMNCDFCNSNYRFDDIDVTLLFPKKK